MAVTLEQILQLAGRLDQSTGFDTARERFRRFLLEYVRDWPTAKPLVEQSQYSPAEQHRVALIDLVLLIGQFIGFHIEFDNGPGTLGSWRSRSHRRIFLDVKSGQADSGSLDRLHQALDREAEIAVDPAVPAAGLCVMAPLFMQRDELSQAAIAAAPARSIGVASLRSLVALADMVASKRSIGRTCRSSSSRICRSTSSWI